MPHANNAQPQELQGDGLSRLISGGSGTAAADPSLMHQHPSSQFAKLTDAYSASGGTVTADAFCAALAQKQGQALSQVARWIVDRTVVSFVAENRTWLPVFQFDPVTLQVTQTARQVVAELRDVFDDTDLAAWFAAPNAWLGEATPADALALRADAVLAAARAERFAAAG